MTKARVVVAALLAAMILGGGAYVAWGDWDRGRIIGLDTIDDDRAGFAEALERRFDELTPAQHEDTCSDVRANGLAASVAFIRERHYQLNARMLFHDDIAERILIERCLVRAV